MGLGTDAVGGPRASAYDGVVGQRDSVEHRRLHAALPALGEGDPGFQ